MRSLLAAIGRWPSRLSAALLRNRGRLPRWVNRSIDAVLDDPNSAVYRTLARAASPYSADALPEPTRRPEGRPSVFIGEANFAGQGHQWARALRTDGIDAANLMSTVPGGFVFDADSVVPFSVQAGSKTWQRAEFERVASYSHALIEAERPLFGTLLRADVRREVAALQSRGLSVAMISHGTDVRSPQRHAASSPLSPFRDAGLYLDGIERTAARNRTLLRELGLPTFVSTPDLIDDVPFAAWCPVVVDPSRWRMPRTPADGPLRVVHAPTNPQLKGSDLIEPMLEDLDRRGVIAYTRIVGASHDEMPALLAGADVLLDQFRLGSYGVAAVEAMAAGCVAIARIDESVRTRVAEASGTDLPIVSATPSELEQVLVELAADRHRLAAIAADSARFVEQVHDGTMSATVLRSRWIDAGEESGR